MIKLYGHELSGNVYKVRLLLSLLNLEYEFTRIDLMKGEHKQPTFLSLNPFGQVPVLTDGETVIADAQAILVYLARQYGNDHWLPMEAEPLSRVMRWLSTATGEVRQGPENARLYHLFGVKTISIERANQQAENILKLIDAHLSQQDWFEFDRPTLADVAIFPYVSLAPEGKISLEPYAHVIAWIERIQQLPGFVAMTDLPS